MNKIKISENTSSIKLKYEASGYEFYLNEIFCSSIYNNVRKNFGSFLRTIGIEGREIRKFIDKCREIIDLNKGLPEEVKNELGEIEEIVEKKVYPEVEEYRKILLEFIRNSTV